MFMAKLNMHDIIIFCAKLKIMPINYECHTCRISEKRRGEISFKRIAQGSIAKQLLDPSHGKLINLSNVSGYHRILIQDMFWTLDSMCFLGW